MRAWQSNFGLGLKQETLMKEGIEGDSEEEREEVVVWGWVGKVKPGRDQQIQGCYI